MNDVNNLWEMSSSEPTLSMKFSPPLYGVWREIRCYGTSQGGCLCSKIRCRYSETHGVDLKIPGVCKVCIVHVLYMYCTYMYCTVHATCIIHVLRTCRKHEVVIQEDRMGTWRNALQKGRS